MVCHFCGVISYQAIAKVSSLVGGKTPALLDMFQGSANMFVQNCDAETSGWPSVLVWLTTRILHNTPLQSVTGVWNLSKKKTGLISLDLAPLCVWWSRFFLWWTWYAYDYIQWPYWDDCESLRDHLLKTTKRTAPAMPSSSLPPVMETQMRQPAKQRSMVFSTDRPRAAFSLAVRKCENHTMRITQRKRKKRWDEERKERMKENKWIKIRKMWCRAEGRMNPECKRPHLETRPQYMTNTDMRMRNPLSPGLLISQLLGDPVTGSDGSDRVRKTNFFRTWSVCFHMKNRIWSEARFKK